MFTQKPLSRYPTPRYPTEGFEIPTAIHQSHWHRVPVKEIVAAVLGGVLIPGCGVFEEIFEEEHIAGGMRPPAAYISEADARAVLAEHFSERGIQLNEDAIFEHQTVSFEADCYDVSRQIGYEYLSDEDYYGDDLSADEQATLENWKTQEGPFFLILQYGAYPYDNEDQRQARLDDLATDVQEFLVYLESQGIL